MLGHSQAEAENSMLFAGVEVVTVYGRIENSSHTHRPCAICLHLHTFRFHNKGKASSALSGS